MSSLLVSKTIVQTTGLALPKLKLSWLEAEPHPSLRPLDRGGLGLLIEQSHVAFEILKA
jgi:hypothetical protein